MVFSLFADNVSDDPSRSSKLNNYINGVILSGYNNSTCCGGRFAMFHRRRVRNIFYSTPRFRTRHNIFRDEQSERRRDFGETVKRPTTSNSFGVPASFYYFFFYYYSFVAPSSSSSSPPFEICQTRRHYNIFSLVRVSFFESIR